LAIAAYVLDTGEHPCADEVWQRVKKTVPMVSRATVYNTLNLFVDKGLLRQVEVGGGRVLFDPKTEPHHHLIDDVSGKVYDVPWDAIEVKHVGTLPDFEVKSYEVVMRGRRRRATSARKPNKTRGH
jgi:Fe2+ or Zn2+ uptake regulation protein